MVTKQNRGKVILALLCIVAGIGLAGGCGKEVQPETGLEGNETTGNEETVQEMPVQETSELKTPVMEEPDEASAQQEAESEQTALLDVLPLQFSFSSGAGGWQTELYLNRDGSFNGIYMDADMGIVGEEYPNGTVHICEFNGCFSDMKQEDPLTARLTLGEINITTKNKEEWVENGILYLPTDPYGLEEGKEFLLYAPETPTASLSKEFLSWWPLRYSYDEDVPDTLTRYGLYNIEMGYGFFS